MNYFEFEKYKYVSVDADGRKVLSVNTNPEKACVFNCRICNLGKTVYQGEWHDFGSHEDSIAALSEKMAEEDPDIVEVTAGQGDVLTNPILKDVIDCVHQDGRQVRIITNCYLLGIPEHMELSCACEEVVAGFCFTEEEAFQYIHRPRPEDEFTAEKQIQSMIEFGNRYEGKFTLRVLLVKGYNDSDEQVMKLKEVVDKVKHTTLWVGTWPKFNVSDDRIEEVKKTLLA